MAHRPTILGVRHGRTALNDPKRPRLRSWENPPLDNSGILDARMAAQMIKRWSPQVVYSSDLTRDMQTAQIIAGELGNIPFEVDYNLRTANMGELAGMLEEDANPMVMRWYNQPWWDAPGGGESLNTFLNRFYPAFDIKYNLAKESEAYRPMVIVSHGRNLAAIHSRANNIPQIDGMMPYPGGIFSIYDDEVGRQQVEEISDMEPVYVDV
jgi:broad specificity phosphatase PhoE